jgi:hypothetical protein
LGKYLDTKKAPTRLIGEVERYMITRKPDTSRRTDVIHPSALCKSDFCARASYFTILGHAAPEEPPGLRLQSIFDEGHSIHHKWQDWIHQMGNLHGKWYCEPNGHVWSATSPHHCPECASSVIEYREVSLYDKDLMIAGHADGWVKGIGDDFLIEIKSIGTGTIRMEQPSLLKDADLSQAWRNIRRPFPTHIRQGMLYLALGHRMVANGILDEFPEEIVFIYELKADQSYKEFTVKRDDDVVKDELDKAYDIAYAVRQGTPPPCSNTIGGTCKQCESFTEDAA